jgi:hypothetical protein
MKKKSLLRLLPFCMALFLFSRCGEEDKEIVLPPAELAYPTNQLEVEEGQRASSVVPTLKGNPPFIFSVTSTPVTNQITIDNQGVVTTLPNLLPGTYRLNVVVTNNAQVVAFGNALTVNVKERQVRATNLNYNPNNLELTSGRAASSIAPTLAGSAPLIFSVTSTPAAPQITIDANTGVLTAGTTTPAGTYRMEVGVTNGAGRVNFPNAYTFTVRAAPNAVVVTFRDVQPSLVVCGNCHNYNTFAAARTNVNAIINRVERPQGSTGFMPRGGTPLTAAQINLLKQWLADGLRE